MVLESPRAGALFRICDPKIATALASLSTPQQVRRLRRQDGFPGSRAARPAGGLPDPFQGRCRRRQSASGRSRAMPISCSGTSTICCSTRAARKAGTPTRSAEPIRMRVSCHHCRRCGRPGLDSQSICARSRRARPDAISPAAKLLRERHSVRSFDDQRPITLAELAQFLDGTARVVSTWQSRADSGRRRSGGRLRRPAVSVGGRQLRARALSGGREMRRARPRILSLRRRRTRTRADRRPRRRSSKRC